MTTLDPEQFVVARRMHFLELAPGEQVPTWFLAKKPPPEMYVPTIADAYQMGAAEALELVCQLGPGHWLAHMNGQAFAYGTDGKIAASIPLEQIP